eukprot:TRINITY_DN2053_c0_g1_i3.p1 TRINITY_DN2053_c0_g1~~TRINITY_DN2053_c0_g1_i3.p1  ORF type:complete len:285 (+),score=82.06 TRINITY_DN2053_c0_g1_i3:31-855(+)
MPKHDVKCDQASSNDDVDEGSSSSERSSSSPCLSSPGECVCALCTAASSPLCLSVKPTWANVVRVACYCLLDARKRGRARAAGDTDAGLLPAEYRCKYVGLNDIHGFVNAHRDKLGICRRNLTEAGLKKSCQDALSHNPKFFASGSAKVDHAGFWRLREPTSPWDRLANFYAPGSAPALRRRRSPLTGVLAPKRQRRAGLCGLKEEDEEEAEECEEGSCSPVKDECSARFDEMQGEVSELLEKQEQVQRRQEELLAGLAAALKEAADLVRSVLN